MKKDLLPKHGGIFKFGEIHGCVLLHRSKVETKPPALEEHTHSQF
ncbi:hypothetical protein HanXRQr2_Chr09g0412941 [Helianthus annuus]|uniref:Uncharacterized protein n=1 Tax=Helianthus annuus TaxID=4232 RepID=A0A9K3NB46_HELAN|nr:hypothetical protein HanXRQr2_Chr09g0412941 [Helianthus annuus]KAJ0895307.1 hypothetical protein HanPSC8_Chr09g0399021 [Helianthus annuus]